MTVQNDAKGTESQYLGKIYRIKDQICLTQERLDMMPGKPILHDYMMLKDKDGLMFLKCRSCGFVNFSWKDIFKGNYGY